MPAMDCPLAGVMKPSLGFGVNCPAGLSPGGVPRSPVTFTDFGGVNTPPPIAFTCIVPLPLSLVVVKAASVGVGRSAKVVNLGFGILLGIWTCCGQVPVGLRLAGTDEVMMTGDYVQGGPG